MTALLERERELAALSEALEAARLGSGAVVLVEAPAGLGKTALLRAALDAADEAGFACLRARASELERDFAYGCVRQLLEAVVARAPDGRRERLFAGAAGHARALFAPAATAAPGASPDAHAAAPAGGTAAPAVSPDAHAASPTASAAPGVSAGSHVVAPAADNAFAMLHGLYWLVDNLAADGPLLLCVDDLHWADAESLRFLAFLAPRLDGLPVAVVAGARPGEGGAADLARLAAAPETVVLRPRPLSDEAVASLCGHALDSPVTPEFAAACREATGGNPFFVEALLRELVERELPADPAGVRDVGPAAVAQAVLLRLSGRPAAATALVRAVAVLGDGASVAEAARLAELPEDQADAAVDTLAALELLRPRAGGGLEFAHAIVREAVYADMGARERARAHAHAAAALAAAGASEQRIAAQIVEAEPAGEPDRVELLRRVAGDALARGAPAAAAAWLRRALVEPPPPDARTDVLLELGVAEHRLGGPAAVDHLAAAIEAIRDDGSQDASGPDALASAVRLLANALTVRGESDRAAAELEAAIAAVEPQDRELALLLEAELASHALQASPEVAAPARRRLEKRGDLGGATAQERLVLASLAFQRARASESAAEAAGIIERALAAGLLDERNLDIVGPFYDLVVGLLATEAFEAALPYIEQGLGDARARGSIPAIAYLTGRRGWVSLRRGTVDRAEDDARTAVGLLTAHGIPLGVPFATALLVEALVERGELEEAQRVADGASGDPAPGPTNNFLVHARGVLLLAQGRTGEGVEALREFGRRDELWGGAHPLASRWRSRVALALDGDDARALAAEDLERARRWGAPGGIGVALRSVALLDGDVAGLREAVAALERSPARLEHARALCDLGAALRRANRRADARGALEQGLELATRLGAAPLADRARTELLAAGGRSSDPYGSGVEQLTASERRVADLAAEGLSNPEIAQALFVTRKTVETHLGHVYGKLGIGGRGQLREALGS